MFAEFITQLNIITCKPSELATKLLDTPVTLYRGTEEYRDHSGNIATTKKWSADGKFARITPATTEQPATAEPAKVEEPAEDMPF